MQDSFHCDDVSVMRCFQMEHLKIALAAIAIVGVIDTIHTLLQSRNINHW